MELEDALATLNLAADCSMQEAESAYASELARLEEGQINDEDGSKDALRDAIAVVKDYLSSGEATLVGVPLPEIPPEDDDATVIMSAVSIPPEDAETVILSTISPDLAEVDAAQPEPPEPQSPPDEEATIVMRAVSLDQAEHDASSDDLSTPEISPDDEATLVMSAVSLDPAEDETTLFGPAVSEEGTETLIDKVKSRKAIVLAAVAVTALVAIGLGFTLSPEEEQEPEQEQEIVEEVKPVPMLREADQVRVLGSKWLNSSDQLARYRQQLASALNAAPEGMHGQLLDQYVINDKALEQISIALKRSFPLDGDLNEASAAHEQLTIEAATAKQRLSDLEDLNRAMNARNDVMMSITALQGQGVDWPPALDTAGEVFLDTSAEQLVALLGQMEATEKGLLAGEFASSTAAFEEITQKISALEVNTDTTTGGLDPQLDELLAQGQAAISRQRLTRPAGESATDYLTSMQALDPQNAKTLELEAAIKSSFLKLINARIAGDQLDSASTLARRSRDILGPSPMLQAAENKIRARRSILAEMRFQPMQPVIEKAGVVMLRIPEGSFDMGTPPNGIKDLGSGFASLIGGLFSNDGEMTKKDQANEEPVHRVDIQRAIAMSRDEITVEQFAQFIKASGYQTDAEKRGYSVAHLAAGDTQVKDKNWRHDYLGELNAPDAPVIHVSYNDAVAFTQWLSRAARARYRLPTESEFEYAARAGELGIYPWGKGSPPDNFENFRGADDKAPPGWGKGRAKPPVRTLSGYSDGAFGPEPAGRYTLNGFGLDNMLGNVAEWTLDCFLAGYTGKKNSQSAREFPGCKERVVRGTSWASDARKVRASHRESRSADYSASTIGFRVVREVNIPDT